MGLTLTDGTVVDEQQHTESSRDRQETFYDWPTLERQYLETMEAAVRALFPSDSALFAQNREFGSGRLNEGRQIGKYLIEKYPHANPIRVLDLGAGNGGVTVGLGNYRKIVAYAIDVVPTVELRDVLNESSLPTHVISASGERLPLASDSFDAILCLETIEHVPNAKAMCVEIMRVLRPGGG